MPGIASSVLLSIKPLGFPYTTQSPFLFAVYHNDRFPVGHKDHMFAPRRGNGADFDWSQPYRMYHGDRIPGFPQHPHRGFETLTLARGFALLRRLSQAHWLAHTLLPQVQEGSCDHSDSLMPLLKTEEPNTLRLFQLWLNLPAKSKMAEPTYVMTWAEQMRFIAGENGAECEIAAGSLAGVSTPVAPPSDSWAADAANDVGVFFVTVPPGGRFTLPPAAGGAAINRTAYLVEGPTDKTVVVGGTPIPGGRGELVLRADAECEVVNGSPAGSPTAHLLVLQGRPIDEPVAQRGPFVMNTDAEIRQAYADYQRTQFGGWPWDADAVVFPREQPRFADLVDAQGKKTRTYPPGGEPKTEL